MGQALIPFAFEDHLVRSMLRGGQPWFVGNDVCNALDITNARNAFTRLDDDEKGVHSLDTLGGVQEVVIISEPGVYRLVFTSRKAEAERFKRWLAHEVLPRLRQEGAYQLPDHDESGPEATPLETRLRLIREARVLFGKSRARALWAQQKLPRVPYPEQSSGKDEARECLTTLLQAELRGRMLRDWIEIALAGADQAEVVLKEAGIRIDADADTFTVANTEPWINLEFSDTPWARGAWIRIIRRLPGIEPAGNMRIGERVSRGTRIPGRYLDIGADPLLRTMDVDD